MRKRLLVPLAAGLCLLVVGCSEGEQACTLIGGGNHLAIEVPRPLFEEAVSYKVEVCAKSRCAVTEGNVPGAPDEVEVPPRMVLAASITTRGRTFEPGSVAVVIRLLNERGAVVAERSQSVKLAPYYPNGKACDGDGWVSGHVAMRLSDRV